MADPRVYDGPAYIVFEEALAEVSRLLEGVPGIEATFAERYANPNLPGSPSSLVEAASLDRGGRDEHGLRIIVGAFARVLAHQQAEIAELKAARSPRSRSAAGK